MAAKPHQQFVISSNYEIRDCPEHGKSNHRLRDGLCAQCHPSKDKGIGADPEAVARRHTIEDHQERRAETDWYGEA